MIPVFLLNDFKILRLKFLISKLLAAPRIWVAAHWENVTLSTILEWLTRYWKCC